MGGPFSCSSRGVTGPLQFPASTALVLHWGWLHYYPQGTLDSVWRQFWSSDLGVLQVFCRWRTKILLHTLPWTEQPPAKNYPFPNVSGAAVGRPCSKGKRTRKEPTNLALGGHRLIKYLSLELPLVLLPAENSYESSDTEKEAICKVVISWNKWGLRVSWRGTWTSQGRLLRSLEWNVVAHWAAVAVC